MNFLSHFYFDRHTTDPERVLGTVLPDLIKNARKDWNPRPEKKKELFQDPHHMAILKGWMRHLDIDKYFHNSAFFVNHTAAIRSLIAPVLSNSVIRPSFVAHISLELMLDSLLLTEQVLEAESLYSILRKADRNQLEQFLRITRLDDIPHFFGYFDTFLESAYLSNYRDPENLIYALSRICLRVWPDPINETQNLQLSAVLLAYYEQLRSEYLMIFDEIESRLMENKKMNDKI